MTLRDAVLTIAVVLLAIILVVTSALTDLRSPAGTAALGATLADDENVRTLIVTGVVDAILEDVTGRSGALGPLVALAEPLLTASVVAALDTPGGRAALTSALTDALRQLSIPGPIVIDLRSAALAAAEDVPAPLDTLIRAAVAQGSVGLLVLGGVDDEDRTVDPPQPLALDDVGRVAGLPPGLARLLSALALVAVGLLLMVPGTRTDAAPGARPTRRSLRLGVAGAALLIIGGRRSPSRRSTTRCCPRARSPSTSTHSSINYKDALVLAGRPASCATSRTCPASTSPGPSCLVRRPGVAPGDEVLVTGCWLGERHWGGMATRARVPAGWVVQRPDGWMRTRDGARDRRVHRAAVRRRARRTAACDPTTDRCS
jgi:hypothetical protein